MDKKELGKFGENQAVKFLEKQNYEIIDRNFACKQGEIDIIAKDKDELVFFEVKTRNNDLFGRAVEAVDNFKQKHIWSAAKYYLYQKGIIDEFVRFDVIEVYVKENKVFINQIRNMFV